MRQTQARVVVYDRQIPVASLKVGKRERRVGLGERERGVRQLLPERGDSVRDERRSCAWKRHHPHGPARGARHFDDVALGLIEAG